MAFSNFETTEFRSHKTKEPTTATGNTPTMTKKKPLEETSEGELEDEGPEVNSTPQSLRETGSESPSQEHMDRYMDNLEEAVHRKPTGHQY